MANNSIMSDFKDYISNLHVLHGCLANAQDKASLDAFKRALSDAALRLATWAESLEKHFPESQVLGGSINPLQAMPALGNSAIAGSQHGSSGVVMQGRVGQQQVNYAAGIDDLANGLRGQSLEPLRETHCGEAPRDLEPEQETEAELGQGQGITVKAEPDTNENRLNTIEHHAPTYNAQGIRPIGQYVPPSYAATSYPVQPYAGEPLAHNHHAGPAALTRTPLGPRVSSALNRRAPATDVADACPCWLQGHDCPNPEACQMGVVCVEPNCTCPRQHTTRTCMFYGITGKKCQFGKNCDFVHDRPGEAVRLQKQHAHAAHHAQMKASKGGRKRGFGAEDGPNGGHDNGEDGDYRRLRSYDYSSRV